MKPKRISSPKGTKLPTGEATRQAILDNLPATARHISDVTGKLYTTVCFSIRLMHKEGLIVAAEERVPVPSGGTPQKVWQIPQARKIESSLNNPWYNAWYERAK